MVALYQQGGVWHHGRVEGGRCMRTVIEQETLAALAETGEAREFRVSREDAWYSPPENDQTLSITPSITSPST